jgi:hypothetical protein
MNYHIGDSIVGKISKIQNVNGEMKFDVDIDDSDWCCQMQWNSGLRNTIKLIRVGDQIEGWIVRKKQDSKYMVIGISNFGKFPPKPNTLNRYFDALLYFKKLILIKNQELEHIERAHFSEIKGLINRCERKDQWDWFIIYKAFGFIDDIEVIQIAQKFNNFSGLYKQFNKGVISEIDFLKKENEFIDMLKKADFLARINHAIVYLNDEARNWEITRIQTPIIKKEDNLANKDTITRIGSHIRRGVAMTESQKLKISNKLENCNLVLTDGTVLSKDNFNSIDWSIHTIVFDYERENLGEVRSAFQAESVISSIETHIKLERANIIHNQLVNTMASKIVGTGFLPLNNNLIDLFIAQDEMNIIFEMKSIHNSNECEQIRKAIAQLYEYRFLHNMSDAELCIVLNKRPNESWILDYILKDRNILICWLNNDKFECPESINTRLLGLMN